MKYFLWVGLLVLIVLLFLSKRYENFEQRSTSSQVGEGASQYWGWGFDGVNEEKRHKKERKCPKCDHVFIDNDVCNIIIDDRHNCKYCDITQNKDIDKYVLKSSVPPCPDMSRFATKAMVHSCPDMNKYVLKSKLPEYCAAYQPDKKCSPCPQKYVNVYNDITKHPEYNKYVSKDNCKKYKRSWIQNFEEWWESLFGGNKKPNGGQQFPRGYGYTPYAGYGTDNMGYLLDGGL